MKVQLICPVRGIDAATDKRVCDYVAKLEAQGIEVHSPKRDVDQDTDKIGLEICTAHYESMKTADRIDIFYYPNSTGIHFDMGMAFALNKPYHLVEEHGEDNPGKSFLKIIKELERRQNNR